MGGQSPAAVAYQSPSQSRRHGRDSPTVQRRRSRGHLRDDAVPHIFYILRPAVYTSRHSLLKISLEDPHGPDISSQLDATPFERFDAHVFSGSHSTLRSFRVLGVPGHVVPRFFDYSLLLPRRVSLTSPLGAEGRVPVTFKLRRGLALEVFEHL